MSGKQPERHWKRYISDMVQFSEKVLRYANGQTKQGFLKNKRHYDATVRNLALLGEAADKIPTVIQVEYAQVPWHQIIGTKDRIIDANLGRGDLGVDDDLIWSLIIDDIPVLVPALREILNTPDP